MDLITDGAYSTSRDYGGAAFVIVHNNKFVTQYSHGFPNTTNNRMELIAIIMGLRSIKNTSETVHIYSDSMYVIGTMTKNWQRKKNLDLWSLLDSQANRFNKVEWHHVKGHNGDRWNELCDYLAREASHGGTN